MLIFSDTLSLVHSTFMEIGAKNRREGRRKRKGRQKGEKK